MEIANAVRILILHWHNAQLRKDTSGLGNYMTVVHGQGIIFWKTGWAQQQCSETLCSAYVIWRKAPDWRDFALEVLSSWQLYLENWVQVAVFKVLFFGGIFMSVYKEKVDSERDKNVFPLPPWKGNLPRRCQESSSQTSLVEAPACHFFVHSLCFL